MNGFVRTVLCGTVLGLTFVTTSCADTNKTADGWLYSIEDDGTACIRGYEGEETNLLLPVKVDGLSAVYIGADAFNGQVSIKKVTIPEGYRYIGAYAFAGCTRLSSLSISGTVQEWGTSSGVNGSFSGCANLFDVEFGEGMTSIGNSTFAECTLLDTVELPSSMVTVEAGAFRDCSMLDIVDAYGDIGASAFENCTYMSKITIHNATEIGSAAFRNCTSFKEVELPDTLLSVGYEAFRGCSKLQGIEIPSSVNYIGCRAFYNCKQFKELSFGGGVIEWGEDYREALPFAECPTLFQVNIKEGIDTIPQGAFYNCDSLEAIAIPEGVVTIQSGAFENCDALFDVSFPSTVKTIESSAFRECLKLSDFTLPEMLDSIGTEAFLHTAETELVIPAKVTTIGVRAFKENHELKTVTLGESITNWPEDYHDNSAFAGCDNLTTLEIEDGVNSIGAYAFQDCVRLQSIEIPSSAVNVGAGAFRNCSALQSATVYRGDIGDAAFESCVSLINLEIRKVSNIGYSAFANCTSLTNVELPRTLIDLGGSAFLNCSSMTSIIIPDSVTGIGSYAFENCSALKTVYVGNNVGDWREDYHTSGVFWNCVGLEYIYFADDSTEIGSECLHGCSSLKGVYIPKTILSIPENLIEEGSPNAVIYGVNGSAAQSFARENGFRFSDEEFPIDVEV